MNQERIPPHSDDAEMAVLGAAMQSNKALTQIIQLLLPEDFFRPHHGEIFRAISDLFAVGASVDILTVTEHMKSCGTLNAAGGSAYVAQVSGSSPSPSGAMEYAKIVKDKATLRKMISESDDLARRCYEDREQAAEIVAAAEIDYASIASENKRGRNDLIEPAVLAENVAANLKSVITQIRIPFTWLNNMTGGIIPGNLITIAGRTSAGKSAFAMQLAKEISGDHRVLYISLEMQPEELVLRYIASETKIAQRDLMLHRVKVEQEDDLASSLKRYAHSRLYFTSSGRDIRAIVALVKRSRPDLVVIDTVNLVKSTGESERVKLLNVTRELKQLALAEDVPIIILAQLSRRADDKLAPTLADIKESASIEEDSDVVLLLTEVENAKKLEQYKTAADIDIGVDAEGLKAIKLDGARLILAMIQKNRNGSLGRAAFRFEGRRFQFTEIGETEDAQIGMGKIYQDEDGNDLPF
jgi:replicative DNA helicase